MVSADANTDQRIDSEAIDFIELATTLAGKPELVDLLTNLGLVETYRHQCQNVSVYQAGAVTVVLNQQPNGPAATHAALHGLGGGAIGLRTKTPEFAAERASALQYAWVASQPEAGGLLAPAVYGPGDILYYVAEASTTPMLSLPLVLGQWAYSLPATASPISTTLAIPYLPTSFCRMRCFTGPCWG